MGGRCWGIEMTESGRGQSPAQKPERSEQREGYRPPPAPRPPGRDDYGHVPTPPPKPSEPKPAPKQK